MRGGITIAFGLAGLGLAGCAQDESGSQDEGGLPSTVTIGDEETGDEPDPDDEGGQLFDVGGDEDGNSGGDSESDGCKKVDLLFVIDDSGSMADEQINLATSVPGFIEEIQTQLAETDGYHVGVVTSDLYPYNGPGCLTEGGLVTRTGGVDSSFGICGPYVDGGNFMTENDDLGEAFSCAALVGTGGDGNERPMQTMLAALGESLGSPGQCNEGFLRDDALLVVVVITDEEDDHEAATCLAAQPGSSGEPNLWFEGVVERKSGIEQNVVVLSLVGPPGPDPAQCPALDKCAGGIMGAEPAHRIEQFTRMFTHGFVGRVCEPSYQSFFSEAVGVVKSACDDFVPPG